MITHQNISLRNIKSQFWNYDFQVREDKDMIIYSMKIDKNGKEVGEEIEMNSAGSSGWFHNFNIFIDVPLNFPARVDTLGRDRNPPLFNENNIKIARKQWKKQKKNSVGCTGEGKRWKGNIREGSREGNTRIFLELSLEVRWTLWVWR